MKLVHLFYWSYWFSEPLPATGLTRIFWIVFPTLLLVVGLGARFLNFSKLDQFKKRLVKQIGKICLTVGVLDLIWFFFRQEQVYLLSFRFWLVFIKLGVVWSLYKIYMYFKKRVPEIKQQQFERERLSKYLPKRKK
jgi:hypothetical protein